MSRGTPPLRGDTSPVSTKLDLSRIGPRLVLGTAAEARTNAAALLSRVGADAQWLAALGQNIVNHHSVPAGVPFAAAPTAHWSQRPGARRADQGRTGAVAGVIAG
jgi:hypothetical protein